MINLMVVEDNEIVRNGLVRFLGKQNDVNIAAEASDGSAAVQQLRENASIDIVIADWNMPDMNGLELTALLANGFPAVKVVILTMHGKQEYKDQARAAGARGYILKDVELDEVLGAVRAVFAGEKVF
jgi:DNA-binding NarL/FixJ family response regulator